MMQAHSLVDALDGLGEVEFKQLDSFNRGSVGVYWAESGISPWERHPEDEELLYVIEGHVTIEILTETHRIEVPVTEVLPSSCRGTTGTGTSSTVS